jgi:hypothetical protein
MSNNNINEMPMNAAINIRPNQNNNERLVEETKTWFKHVQEKELVVPLVVFLIIYSTISGDKCIIALLVTIFFLNAKKYFM